MTPTKRTGTRKTSRKPAKKKSTAVKRTVKKKAVKKRTVRTAGKKTAQKIILKKKAPTAKRRTASTGISIKRPITVQPGPPSIIVPPVEEPSIREEAIGIVTHFYSHLGVAVVQVNKGRLKTGDTIHITGRTTDITQTVDSIEYEHQHADSAEAGQSVGIKVAGPAREHDIVYIVR